MRIAVYHNLPSGGGKRAVLEMTRRLATKHEVDVYTLSGAEHDFCDLRPHCRRHIAFSFRPLPLVCRPFGRLNQGIRSLDLLRLRTLQRQIATQIDAAGYDVVFVHNCQYGQSPSLLTFLQTPSIYYCQEPPRHLYEPHIDRPYDRHSTSQKLGNLFDPFPRLYRRTLATLDRRNVHAAHLVLVNSAYSRETLYRTYGIFARVCYLGVDTEHFRPLSLQKGDFVFSVGRLNPRKGFDFLLESLSKIEETERPSIVIVSDYTDPQEYLYLCDLAKRLKVSVTFQGLVSDDELVCLYNQAKLTVYTPIMEPFGFVPLESMACGTPVVAVREGGIRETVRHNENGLLLERDPQLFADAVVQLLSDPGRYQQFITKGRQHVEASWSWTQCLRNIDLFLSRTAGGQI